VEEDFQPDYLLITDKFHVEREKTPTHYSTAAICCDSRQPIINGGFDGCRKKKVEGSIQYRDEVS
jgi:hypothetical protein